LTHVLAHSRNEAGKSRARQPQGSLGGDAELTGQGQKETESYSFLQISSLGYLPFSNFIPIFKKSLELIH
jgi:hypothetical protein